MALFSGFCLGLAATTLHSDTKPAVFTPAQQGRLIDLFRALRAVPTAQHAFILEHLIWQEWQRTPLPLIPELMSQAAMAQSLEDSQGALKAYGEIIALDPHYIPAYDQRAALRYRQRNTVGALEDIEACLRLDPRHFGAWVGLGAIFEDLELYEAAEKAYNQALKYHPHLKLAKDGLRRTQRHLHGPVA